MTEETPQPTDANGNPIPTPETVEGSADTVMSGNVGEGAIPAPQSVAANTNPDIEGDTVASQSGPGVGRVPNEGDSNAFQTIEGVNGYPTVEVGVIVQVSDIPGTDEANLILTDGTQIRYGYGDNPPILGDYLIKDGNGYRHMSARVFNRRYPAAADAKFPTGNGAE